jgi:GntR family transcriptional regulator/MocR family aminotransferase
MARPAAQIPIELFEPLRGQPEPYYLQLYETIRQAILNGRLPPDTALPGARALARWLRVSRGTVVNAYEMLLYEGYLYSRPRSGMFVASILPDNPLVPLSLGEGDLGSVAGEPIRPSHQQPGNEALDDEPVPPFDENQPAIEAFPFKIWSRLAVRRLRRIAPYLYTSSTSTGYRPLREAIASYVAAARSVDCDPDQVFVVAGSRLALALVIRALLSPGSPVMLEDPGHDAAYEALREAGMRVLAVPVDEEGLDVEAAMTVQPTPRLVFITPSHQYPLGVTMSLRRRLALIDWARRESIWVLEDDLDGEFRYSGRPLPALTGIDHHQRTIYLANFGRVLLPGLNLSYLIVPDELVDTFVHAREFMDLHPPILEQVILTDFIVEGHFARHIRRLRELYAQRQAVLLEAAGRDLTGLLDLVPRQSGMYLHGWLAEDIPELEAVRRAEERGIYVNPIGAFRSQPRPEERGGLVLGFAGFDALAIQEGVRQLAQALEEARSA